MFADQIVVSKTTWLPGEGSRWDIVQGRFRERYEVDWTVWLRTGVNVVEELMRFGCCER